MANATPDTGGLALMEMRCPHCGALQQLPIRRLTLQPRLIQCCSCQQLLVTQLTVKTKPNHILWVLNFLSVAANTAAPLSDDASNKGD